MCINGVFTLSQPFSSMLVGQANGIVGNIQSINFNTSRGYTGFDHLEHRALCKYLRFLQQTGTLSAHANSTNLSSGTLCCIFTSAVVS